MTGLVTKSYTLNAYTVRMLARELEGPAALIFADACLEIGDSVTDTLGNVKGVQIDLALDQREAICSRLQDVLAAKGFQSDWEVNGFGNEIESLIDLFNPF